MSPNNLKSSEQDSISNKCPCLSRWFQTQVPCLTNSKVNGDNFEIRMCCLAHWLELFAVILFSPILIYSRLPLVMNLRETRKPLTLSQLKKFLYSEAWWLHKSSDNKEVMAVPVKHAHEHHYLRKIPMFWVAGAFPEIINYILSINILIFTFLIQKSSYVLGSFYLARFMFENLKLKELSNRTVYLIYGFVLRKLSWYMPFSKVKM